MANGLWSLFQKYRPQVLTVLRPYDKWESICGLTLAHEIILEQNSTNLFNDKKLQEQFQSVFPWHHNTIEKPTTYSPMYQGEMYTDSLPSTRSKISTTCSKASGCRCSMKYSAIDGIVSVSMQVEKVSYL